MTLAAFVAPHHVGGLSSSSPSATKLMSSSLSSSFHLASEAITTIDAATQQQISSAATAVVQDTTVKTFEPIMPDTSALIGIVAVIVLSALATSVWANQVVPTSRTNLAISKSRGAVKDYLEELEEVENEDNNETDNTTNQRQLERWLFTDWLEQRKRQNQRKPGRQKQPALPVLKDAKWNSGDNPILAATALILLGVIFTSVTERVATFF